MPVASQGKPPRWLQAVSGPALPGAGHIWPARARLARPRRPEGACLRRALVAERGRPGRARPTSDPACRGPRGRADRQRRRPGEPGQGRVRALRAEGTASVGGESPARSKVAPRKLSSRRRSPSRRNCLLPWAFISCFVGAGSPRTALFSSFAFQILLCLAFWRPTFLKAPFPLRSIPIGAEAGQLGDVPMSQIGNLRGRSERAESPSPGRGS